MSDAPVDIVVKIGGSLLEHPVHIAPVLETLDQAAAAARLLIVPGGGPFADTVRDVDRKFGLSDEAAHWMAILAIDQYAHLLVSRLRAAAVVWGPPDIAVAYERRRLPVLAPSHWLRDANPLPHSWDVTGDSIAAWVAGAVGAARLVLVKPPDVSSNAVDAYFDCALPAGLSPAAIVPADQTDRLRECLTV
jgi:aspartokinase-like uncharacterized kinase